jgi:hypothetical protein
MKTELKQILRNARRRYHAALPADRLALDCPTSSLGLFTAEELVELAMAGAWPLSARAKRYIRWSPAAQRAKVLRRRRHWLADLFEACAAKTALLKRLLWAVLKSRGRKGMAK